MTMHLGRWRGSDAVSARAVRVDNGFLVRAAPAAPRQRSEHIHVYFPEAPRARARDAAAGAPGERAATGGLSAVKKDQETEPNSAGFDQENENCKIRAGDRFIVRRTDANGMQLSRMTTGDEADPGIVGTLPPGSTGDQRAPYIHPRLSASAVEMKRSIAEQIVAMSDEELAAHVAELERLAGISSDTAEEEKEKLLGRIKPRGNA